MSELGTRVETLFDQDNKFDMDMQNVARQVEALRSGTVKLYSLDEAEMILDETLARHEVMIQSAKKIAKSAKEEYDLLNG
ncbi:MAG: hypothetical protein QG558_113 [Campylobacterota bacterium]|nr:hypothetical protein [Campylobacterota bacterium]